MTGPMRDDRQPRMRATGVEMHKGEKTSKRIKVQFH